MINSYWGGGCLQKTYLRGFRLNISSTKTKYPFFNAQDSLYNRDHSQSNENSQDKSSIRIFCENCCKLVYFACDQLLQEYYKIKEAKLYFSVLYPHFLQESIDLADTSICNHICTNNTCNNLINPTKVCFQKHMQGVLG